MPFLIYLLLLRFLLSSPLPGGNFARDNRDLVEEESVNLRTSPPQKKKFSWTTLHKGAERSLCLLFHFFSSFLQLGRQCLTCSLTSQSQERQCVLRLLLLVLTSTSTTASAVFSGRPVQRGRRRRRERQAKYGGKGQGLPQETGSEEQCQTLLSRAKKKGIEIMR